MNEESCDIPSNANLYLDFDQLTCLFGDDLSNPPEEVVEMLRNLLKDSFVSLQNLDSKWDHVAPAERNKIIHGMRGTMINFGLSRTCSLLQEIELNVSQFSPSELRTIFSQAFASFDESVNILRKIFPTLNP